MHQSLSTWNRCRKARNLVRSALNTDTVYGSIIFAYRTKSIKFIKFILSKLNLKTYSRRLKSDSCETKQHETDPLAAEFRHRHHHNLLHFFATVRTWFPCLPHHALIQPSVTDIDYYISSRLAACVVLCAISEVQRRNLILEQLRRGVSVMHCRTWTAEHVGRECRYVIRVERARRRECRFLCGNGKGLSRDT